MITCPFRTHLKSPMIILFHGHLARCPIRRTFSSTLIFKTPFSMIVLAGGRWWSLVTSESLSLWGWLPPRRGATQRARKNNYKIIFVERGWGTLGAGVTDPERAER